MIVCLCNITVKMLYVRMCMCTSDLCPLLLIYHLGAVHRYYESRRGLFNDSRPSRVGKVQVLKKNSKKQALRKQVFSSILNKRNKLTGAETVHKKEGANN